MALVRAQQTDSNLILKRYVAERFLYRVGLSNHREVLILKGAMLWVLWGGPLYRPTRDLDLAAHIAVDETVLADVFRDIALIHFADDGVKFDAASIRVERIRDPVTPRGFRVRLSGALGTARVGLQVDIGLGDLIVPAARDEDYPTLLDMPGPRIRVYPREAVVAEKLHAIVRRGAASTRYKDFYDLYALASQFRFDGSVLGEAIGTTFRREGTVILPGASFEPGTDYYADPARGAAWIRFTVRDRLAGVPRDFDHVGALIDAFLGPVWEALARQQVFHATWTPGGPWEGKP